MHGNKVGGSYFLLLNFSLAVFYGQKMRMSELRAKGSHLVIPTWTEEELVSVKDEWGIYDRARCE